MNENSQETSSVSYFFRGLVKVALLPFTLSWIVIKFISEFIWAICVTVFCFVVGIILAPVWIIRACGGDPKANSRSYSDCIYDIMYSLHKDTAEFFSQTLGIPNFKFGTTFMYKSFCVFISTICIIYFSMIVYTQCNTWQIEAQEAARIEQLRKEEERKKLEQEHPIITTGIKTLRYILNK